MSNLARPPEGSVRDWLERRAEENGDLISHLFPDHGSEQSWRAVTWAEIHSQAAHTAARLTGLGVRKGESVALMLPNSHAGVTCLLGALYGGFRATPINLAAGATAVAYALTHSQARFAFVDASIRAIWDEARPKSVSEITVLDGAIDWPDCQPSTPPIAAAQDDALLMYTSGTTGRPKGVLHSHASLLAGGWTTMIAHQLTAQDRALCILPIYHINGLCVTVMGPLVSGGSVAVPSRFSASRFWAQCATAEATWFSAVPTIISHLLHGEGVPDQVTCARLRFARSASSALAIETQRAFEDRFGVPIIETMGLTETAAQILSNPLPPGVRKIGSPGVAYGNEVAILTSDLTRAAMGQVGEIAVRGANVMRGYLHNPEATAAAFTEDGWLRTGDLARIDSDGYVFVSGRLKELIIKGGENIAPREIDEALYSHPDVVEAAAFARPCQIYGERVEAAVTLRMDGNVSSDELIDLCRSLVGEFKSPDFVHILPELPKGPSGKIQRLRLSDLIMADDH